MATITQTATATAIAIDGAYKDFIGALGSTRGQ